MIQPSCLIIGCGYLGLRLAKSLLLQHIKVYATTRGRESFLAGQGIEPIQADVLDPPSLTQLPVVDDVVYAVAPDRSRNALAISMLPLIPNPSPSRGEGDKQPHSMHTLYTQGLQNVLTALPTPKRFHYVSSTSVYGQENGEWVNTESATVPTSESGKTVLEAEQILRKLLPVANILRFAGIYGPDRVLLRATIEKEVPLSGDANRWLNLIHVDDGVSVIEACIRTLQTSQTFIVADQEPMTRGSFYRLMAMLLGKKEPKFTGITPADDSTNRRMDAHATWKTLGIEPLFPTYREGLADAIARSTS